MSDYIIRIRVNVDLNGITPNQIAREVERVLTPLAREHDAVIKRIIVKERGSE